LVVNGSVHATAQAQTQKACDDTFHRVYVPAELLISGLNPETAGLFQRFAEEIARAGTRSEHLILQTLDPASPRRCWELAEPLGLSPSEIPHRVAENLGMLLQRLLSAQEFPMLIVIGGDTLQGIARAFGWTGLIPHDELASGVVVSEIPGNKREARRWLAAKPGGFGPDDVLLALRDTICSGQIPKPNDPS
jgi:uncharacterized protein YgbK (DUF1537 family)